MLRVHLASAVALLRSREVKAAVDRVRRRLRSKAPRFEGALADLRGVASELTISRATLVGAFGEVDVHAEVQARLDRLEAPATRLAALEEARQVAQDAASGHLRELRAELIRLRTAWNLASGVSGPTLPRL